VEIRVWEGCRQGLIVPLLSRLRCKTLWTEHKRA
jgi:hypothetical protein